jgi:hypothetical protein
MSEFPKEIEIEFEGYKVKCSYYGIQVLYEDDDDNRERPFGAHVSHFDLGGLRAICHTRIGRDILEVNYEMMHRRDSLAFIEALVCEHRRAIKDPAQLEMDSRGA